MTAPDRAAGFDSQLNDILRVQIAPAPPRQENNMTKPIDPELRRDATVHLLQEGYVREDEAGQHVGPSIGLILDGDAVVVVDPGMVPDRRVLLDSAAVHGVLPGDVTDVVFSHHHPDHTVNAALFPRARIHDHWAIYDGDVWHSRAADGYSLSPSVRLLATPGHSSEDITTCVGTSEEVVAFTHAWWSVNGPDEDPHAPDQEILLSSRARIQAVCTLIVPGHGATFRPAQWVTQ